jgi:hypothetical protein
MCLMQALMRGAVLGPRAKSGMVISQFIGIKIHPHAGAWLQQAAAIHLLLAPAPHEISTSNRRLPN